MSVINEDKLDVNAAYIGGKGITVAGKTIVFQNIKERNSHTPKPTFAWVIDATDDPTVDSGSAFYMNTINGWKKLYETEIMDQDNLSQTINIPNMWDQITGGPQSTPSDIDDAVELKHSHANQLVLNDLSDDDGSLAYKGLKVNIDNSSEFETINDTISSLRDELDSTTSSIEELTESVSSKVTKEQGKDLFSGKYADLTGTPTFPDFDTFATTDEVEELLSSVVKTDEMNDALATLATTNYVNQSLTSKSNTGHTHMYADILNTPTDLATESYVNQAISDLVSKTYVDQNLERKADISHTHTKSQITDLGTIGNMLKTVYDTDNDGKVDTAQQADAALTVPWSGVIAPPDFATRTHSHAISDVTELASELQSIKSRLDALEAMPQGGSGSGGELNFDITPLSDETYPDPSSWNN